MTEDITTGTDRGDFWGRKLGIDQALAEQQEIAAQNEIREARLRGYGIPTAGTRVSSEPSGRPRTETEAASQRFTATGKDPRERVQASGLYADPWENRTDGSAADFVNIPRRGQYSDAYAEYKRTGRIV